MGFFGRLVGRYAPKPGTASVTADQLKADLLALNRPTAPFVIRECTADDPENADLVAEWRMREPTWYAIFGSANLSHAFQVFMRLLPETHQVQSIDRMTDVNWSGGAPSFSYSKTWSRGLQWEYRGSILPFYETTPDGERIAYRFSSSELKKPLHDLVASSGWSWRSRVAGRLPAGGRSQELRKGQPIDARTRWITVWAAFLLSFGFVYQMLTPLSILIQTRSQPGGSRLPLLIPVIIAVVAALIVARLVFKRMIRW